MYRFGTFGGTVVLCVGGLYTMVKRKRNSEEFDSLYRQLRPRDRLQAGLDVHSMRAIIESYSYEKEKIYLYFEDEAFRNALLNALGKGREWSFTDLGCGAGVHWIASNRGGVVDSVDNGTQPPANILVNGSIDTNCSLFSFYVVFLDAVGVQSGLRPLKAVKTASKEWANVVRVNYGYLSKMLAWFVKEFRKSNSVFRSAVVGLWDWVS